MIQGYQAKLLLARRARSQSNLRASGPRARSIFRAGHIYSSRALDIDTGVMKGQKQAKNGLKWQKLALPLQVIVIRNFLPVFGML